MSEQRRFTVTLLGSLLVILLVVGCIDDNQSASEHSNSPAQAAGATGEQSDFERILSTFTAEEQEVLRTQEGIDAEFVEFFISEGFSDVDIRMMMVPAITMAMAAAEHPAAVLVGDQLDWRVLQQWDPAAPEQVYSHMDVTNFDSDPADEVLLDYPTGLELYEAVDGSSTPVVGHSEGRNYQVCWDMDGDGAAELLNMVEQPASFDANQTVSVMEATNLAGEHVGYVRGHAMGPNIVCGDYDGDGLIDLFMAEESPYDADMTRGAQAFGTGGEVIFSAPAEWNSPYILSGDFNGDGCDELLNTMAYSAASLGLSGTEEPLPVWQKHFPFEMPGFACDINRDGTDELFAAEGQVCDLANDQTWQLELPQDWDAMHIDGIFGPNLYAVDLADLPGARMAAIASDAGIYCETLAIWGEDGTLVYAEYFGELVKEIGLARDGGTQRIVLLTESRLLIWP